MKLYTLIPFLFFLGLSFVLRADSKIPFVEVNGLFIVEGEFNGVIEHFIFDSGATDIMIDDRNDLVVDGISKFSTPQGVLESNRVVLDHLIIGGNITIENQFAFTMDMSSMSSFTSMDIRGIIGAQLFDGVLQFDFTNNEIHFVDQFSNPNSDWNTVPLTIVDGIPLVTIENNGIELIFILDSGASCHILDEKAANGLSNADIKLTNTKVLTASGPNANVSTVDLDIKIGRFNYIASRFLLQDMSTISKDLDIPISGILSLSALNLSSIIFDFSSELVLIK